LGTEVLLGCESQACDSERIFAIHPFIRDYLSPWFSEKFIVPHSVIEAIKMGMWDYEPKLERVGQMKSTEALPGSTEKLAILAERLRSGLPLWHPSDRLSYEEDSA
jgi:hypothetical protein